MDIERIVRTRAHELYFPGVEHQQPWLKHLLERNRPLELLCEAVTCEDRDRELARSCHPFVRLKPGGGVRELLLAPIEVDLRMAIQSSPLVDVLEHQVRRSVSFSSPARFHDGIWSIPRFKKQLSRDPPGSRYLYASTLKRMKQRFPYIAEIDVLRYFASVKWPLLVKEIGRLAGIPIREVDRCLALHGEVWWASPATSGMPAGLDLSSVLGTALLTSVDDHLLALVDDLDTLARWMDDITVGADDPHEGRRRIQTTKSGPLRRIRLLTHPDKTGVVESEEYVPNDPYEPVFVAAAHDDVLPGRDAIAIVRSTRPGHIAPRAAARGIINSVTHDIEVEEATCFLADNASRLLNGNDQVLRSALRGAVADSDPLPAHLTDRVLASVRTGTRPGSPGDGEASRLLLRLAHTPGVEVGRHGRRHLTDLATRRRRCERTRVAATWILSDACGAFDRRILDHLEGTSVSTARGLLAAAQRAGLRPTPGQWAHAAPPGSLS